ncbi:MAG: heme-binding domain-containing protein [Bacteroidia bacterium]|nr:heme-binding domain-containing protein [Bacteroidia bacterium]
MKKYFTLKKIALFLLLVFALIQFIRIDKTAPNSDPKKDFLAMNSASDEIKNILKIACYDCHSSQTVYPWYSEIAPISWWLKDHVNEGRKELNFSEWGNYKSRKQDHKLEECAEMVEEGEMPLNSYTWTHKKAILNEEQKGTLVRWFNSLRTHESDSPTEEE